MKCNLQKFGKVYDLTAQLSGEKATIVAHGIECTVNDGFSTILKIDKLMKSNISQVEMIQEFFVIVFGQETADALLALDLRINAYKIIMQQVLDIIKGDEDDEGNAEATAGTTSMMTGT